MKFGQLIEYNMKNIYIGKSYTKYGEDASTRAFFKIKIDYISGSTVSNVLKSVFTVMSKPTSAKIY